jgi:hypothetical protein
MNSAEEQPDYCPHCQGLLEIVFVNFSFRGADIIVSCPNCAIAFTNNRTPPKPGSAGKAESLKGLDSRTAFAEIFIIETSNGSWSRRKSSRCQSGRL